MIVYRQTKPIKLINKVYLPGTFYLRYSFSQIKKQWYKNPKELDKTKVYYLYFSDKHWTAWLVVYHQNQWTGLNYDNSLANLSLSNLNYLYSNIKPKNNELLKRYDNLFKQHPEYVLG